METNQTEKDIAEYIKARAQRKNPVSFWSFVADNRQYIIQNTTINECKDLQATWASRFGNVAKKLKVELTDIAKKPDWGEVGLEILKRIAAKTKPTATEAPSSSRAEVPSPTTPSSSRPSSCRSSTDSSSSSAGSKFDSFPLTSRAKEEFEQRFLSLDKQKKWLLKSGRYVEDIMHMHGSNLKNEHPVHSFILCIDDPVWREIFTSEEFEEIITHGNDGLPEIEKGTNELLAAVEERAATLSNEPEKSDEDESAMLNSITDAVMEFGPYDFRTNFDLYWLYTTLLQLLAYYKYEVIAGIMSNISEMDLVVHFWSLLDRCFDNIKVITARDRTCRAASLRINADRSVITGTDKINAKKTASRPDLLLIKNGIEYGCSEIGKSMDIVATKKEVVETHLHNPKTMKDLFNRVLDEVENNLDITRKLKIVCLHHTSRRMKMTVMDCPGGYVCRVQETDEYEIPMKISSLAAQIIPILTLTLQAKAIVTQMTGMIEAYKNKPKGKPQLKTMKGQQQQKANKGTTTITLPPALTTFAPPTTRKRKSDQLE